MDHRRRCIRSSHRRSWPILPRGQDELKGCSVTGVRGAPQAPSMGPADRLAYPQPHAQSVGLRRVQGLEELIDTGPLEPHPCLLHGDQHTGVGADIVSTSTDEQPTPPTRDVAHRLDRVGQQIQYDLLKLNPIAENRWQIVRQRSPQHDTMTRPYRLEPGVDCWNSMLYQRRILF